MLSALGRFCFRHRRAVLLAWPVAFVAGIGAGVQVLPPLTTDYSGSSIESFAGFDLLTESAAYGPRISALLPMPAGAAQERRVAAATAAPAWLRAVHDRIGPRELVEPPPLHPATVEQPDAAAARS
ncbi:MAG TPA: hypothetical protein VF227_13700 [Actinomycetes bacterium]